MGTLIGPYESRESSKDVEDEIVAICFLREKSPISNDIGVVIPHGLR